MRIRVKKKREGEEESKLGGMKGKKGKRKMMRFEEGRRKER